jgi:diguanylate cyclase (GGDEF)-like protein
MEECQGESAIKAAGQIQVTVSIGIACFSPGGMKKERVIDYADRALYRAKNDGRNRVEVYDIKSCVTR